MFKMYQNGVVSGHIMDHDIQPSLPGNWLIDGEYLQIRQGLDLVFVTSLIMFLGK